MKKFTIEDFPNIGGVMCSKMVVDEKYKPNFIFREKPNNDADSGWVIFSGLESNEYSNNPNNFGIYSPRTILEIDNSISEILLYKGIGSVWEKDKNEQWQEVFDYPLESDFIEKHKLTENWSLSINNLFVRKKEENSLMYTTVDKTLRLDVWSYEDKSKEEIFKEKEQEIENRKSELDIINIYKFDEKEVLKIGYHIKEFDEQKDYKYNLICGFSIVDNEVLVNFFYFDNQKDLKWCMDTWKNIKYKNNYA